MSLVKNFAYNSVYRILLILTPFITTPYLARVLGPDGVGVYSYTYSIADYFVLFATLGMSTYGVRKIAISRGEDKEKISRLFSSIYYSQVIVAVLVLSLYLIFIFLMSDGDIAIYQALWAFWVLSAALDVSWLFFGLEDFKMPTIRSTVVKLLELISILTFVRSADDLWIYVLITSLGFLLTQASLWLFIGKYARLTRVTPHEVIVHFKPNLILFIPVIAIGVFSSMDRIILGVVSTMSQVGYFDYSDKINKMPKAVITALGVVMLPRMSSLFSGGKHEEGLLLIQRTTWFMLGVGLLMAFGIAAIAPEFAPVFLGNEFVNCSGMIMIMTVVLPFSILSNIIGRQYLLPMMREHQYTVTTIVGVIADFIVCICLAPRLGAYGACVANVIGEAAVALSQLMFVRKELPIRDYIKQAVPFFIVGAAMFVAIRAFVSVFSAVLGISIKLLVLEVVVGIAFVTTVSGAYFSITKNDNFSYLLNRIVRLIPHK